MSELFARRLSGKPIVGIGGTDYGRSLPSRWILNPAPSLDLVVGSDSGPSSVITSLSDDDGRLRIPVSNIETVNDRIVVRSDS